MPGQARQERFSRSQTGKPALAEAPRAESLGPVDLDAAELLARLEVQAVENGRLSARAEALERAARSEREARRRLASTLKRERAAAAALHARAERDRELHAAASEELEQLRESAAAADLHLQQAWARLADAERRLAQHETGLWRRLFRRRTG